MKIKKKTYTRKIKQYTFLTKPSTVNHEEELIITSIGLCAKRIKMY